MSKIIISVRKLIEIVGADWMISHELYHPDDDGTPFDFVMSCAAHLHEMPLIADTIGFELVDDTFVIDGIIYTLPRLFEFGQKIVDDYEENIHASADFVDHFGYNVGILCNLLEQYFTVLNERA
jgi:hypothetical protein